MIYFKGKKVNLTGKSNVIHGSLFHEAIYLEGPNKGQTCWIADCLIRK